MLYKIYVHHNYSYERFWYFFHGVDVDINDVIIHTNVDNAFNKFIPITDKINIKCRYNQIELDITFVGSSDWHLNGHHILDYSIDLYDRELVSDRGFNSNIRKIVDNEYIPLLNSKAKLSNTKYHFMYIDWEGHNPYYEHRMDVGLNKNVNLYVDEIDDEIPNKYFVFTNTFMSFIYPNTLKLRDYFFFADILKYKNDYKHKINYPIRRIYGNKIKLYNKIIGLTDRKINITHSSFHNDNHYAGNTSVFRDNFIESIGEDNFIEKRGYGIDDWGGEWNSNNLSEFMWKMFGISEVNIIPEYNPYESIEYGDFKKTPNLIGKSFITEKSVSHILANKPFIPLSYCTIEFYNNILKENNYKVVDYPLNYNYLVDTVDELNNIANNEIQWKLFVTKLKEWNTNTRNAILDIINTKNSLLDIILSEPITSHTQSIL